MERIRKGNICNGKQDFSFFFPFFARNLKDTRSENRRNDSLLLETIQIWKDLNNSKENGDEGGGAFFNYWTKNKVRIHTAENIL